MTKGKYIPFGAQSTIVDGPISQKDIDAEKNNKSASATYRIGTTKCVINITGDDYGHLSHAHFLFVLGHLGGIYVIVRDYSEPCPTDTMNPFDKHSDPLNLGYGSSDESLIDGTKVYEALQKAPAGYSVREGFLKAAADAREDLVAAWLELRPVVDVNCKEPGTDFTALHYAASRDARWLLKVLIRQKELDYLVKDWKGRLPSTLAFEIAENPVIGTFLMKKEIKQAEERGIDYRALLMGEIEP